MALRDRYWRLLPFRHWTENDLRLAYDCRARGRFCSDCCLVMAVCILPACFGNRTSHELLPRLPKLPKKRHTSRRSDRVTKLLRTHSPRQRHGSDQGRKG